MGERDAVRHRHVSRAHERQPKGLIAAIGQPCRLVEGDYFIGQIITLQLLPKKDEIAGDGHALQQQQGSARNEIDICSGIEQRSGRSQKRNSGHPD
jgi:hypothetical protein